MNWDAQYFVKQWHTMSNGMSHLIYVPYLRHMYDI